MRMEDGGKDGMMMMMRAMMMMMMMTYIPGLGETFHGKITTDDIV